MIRTAPNAKTEQLLIDFVRRYRRALENDQSAETKGQVNTENS